ncbi:MAG: hypothetical protein L3K23_07140 [Thermoplasmata archaeon]|nr:hypothetical protein [Thermoplasmata archaeon]
MHPAATRHLSFGVVLAGLLLVGAAFVLTLVPVAGLGGTGTIGPGHPVVVHYQVPNSWALSLRTSVVGHPPASSPIPAARGCTRNCTLWEITWTGSGPVDIGVAWCELDAQCGSPTPIASGSGASGKVDFYGENDYYYQLSASGPTTVSWGYPNGNVLIASLLLGVGLLVGGAVLTRVSRRSAQRAKEAPGTHGPPIVPTRPPPPPFPLRRLIVRSLVLVELRVLLPLMLLAALVVYTSSLPGVGLDATGAAVIGSIMGVLGVLFVALLWDTRRDLKLAADLVTISATGIQGASSADPMGTPLRPELAAPFSDLSACFDEVRDRYGRNPARLVVNVPSPTRNPDSAGALLRIGRHRMVYLSQADLERVRTAWTQWRSSLPGAVAPP